MKTTSWRKEVGRYAYGYDEGKRTYIHKDIVSFTVSILGYWVGLSWPII